MNEKLTKLKGLLYSRSESGKTTIYYAIAYFLVYRTNFIEESSNDNITIKELTDEVCELAILDRVRVEKTIKNLHLFANVKKSLCAGVINTTYPTNFESALFIDRFIGTDVLKDVNDNMDLFNNVVNLMNEAKKDIFDYDKD